MKTIAIINNKGGTGKTTVTINLSAYLSMHKHQTLIIDMDWQRSAGLSLGFPRDPDGVTVAEVLYNKATIKDAIRETSINNLSIILASKDLENYEEKQDDSLKLKKAIKQLGDKYEYILVDCNPGLNLLTKSALLSADSLIIPITPDRLGLEGLALLTKEVIDPDSSDYKILLNQVDNRTINTQEIIEFVRKEYKGHVFNTEISRTVRITEATNWNKSIFDHDFNSRGSQDFQRLGKEFLTWL